ncbi:MAG TPA: YggS family pyridoxal phosphate-dependent enzyme [Pirellulales bacterium]|nr:YggS family pyridoxal phosphate-dependent enzyme [Pirellulales bacterium]
MTNDLTPLTGNLARIRERIADAALASGRIADAVTLVAVTKYVEPSLARALAEAGCLDLGESRPQELWRKAEALADLPVRWHLIGHLQRNKIARTLPLVSLVHSADSLRLIEAIDAEAAALPRPVPVLLEVNISGEAAKHGFTPDELAPLGPRLAALAHIEVRGLMCMASRDSDQDQARREFERLRILRDRLRGDWPDRLRLDELSMGMSGDFEAAIAEGATLVRIGSSLFER